MDLNHLAVFVAVAEHHSFTQAADELGLQRSAVSRRVAALEAELGVQLLIRSTRHVEVSTAGRRLLEDVAPLLSRLEAAVHQLPERSEVPAGELRITAPPDVSLRLLPPVLGELTAKYPRIHPILHPTNRVVDLEREGFDVAIRVALRGLPDSDLRARRIGRICSKLYGAPAYLAQRGAPESLDALSEHVLVGLSGVAPDGLRPRSTVQAGDMLLAAELAKHGVGLAVLPTFLADEAVEAGALVPLLDGEHLGEAELFALFPSSRELPPKITAFRDVLLAHLDEHPL